MRHYSNWLSSISLVFSLLVVTIVVCILFKINININKEKSNHATFP